MAEVKGYSGWTLFDKVLIVAKKIGHWDYQQNRYIEEEDWQGYIVDPSNKKMRETAQAWAETCRSKYDENGKYCGYDRTPGEEFLYDNDGFRLELKETAGGSSQGGKLSFWNCWVTAIDGKRFKVGIAADLLLDLLMSSVFENGKCKDNVFFARQAKGVGMLHKGMESYQQALADMQKKKDVKSKKTSKHKVGYAYSALQEVSAYVSDLYLWYEPIKKAYQGRYGLAYHGIVGYRKLEKPKKLYWFDRLNNYEDGKMYKTSSCKPTPGVWQQDRLRLNYWELRDKLPARIEVGLCVEYDLSVEDCIEHYYAKEVLPQIEKHLNRKERGEFSFGDHDLIGLSTNPESYEMPDTLKKALASVNIYIEE